MNDKQIKILTTILYIVSVIIMLVGAYLRFKEQTCGGDSRLIIIAGLVLCVLAILMENNQDKKKIKRIEKELLKKEEKEVKDQ